MPQQQCFPRENTVLESCRGVYQRQCPDVTGCTEASKDLAASRALIQMALGGRCPKLIELLVQQIQHYLVELFAIHD